MAFSDSETTTQHHQESQANPLNDLWQEKYRPTKLSEYLDYQKYADRITSWLRPIRESGRTPRPFLVLYGEPGVGKTTMAHCIYAEYGDYSVIECNASEARTKDELHKVLQTGTYVHEFTMKGIVKKRIGIIMDELDGIYGNELDGIGEIVNNTFMEPIDRKVKGYKDIDYQVRYPVILTSNSLKGDKYKAILDHAVAIKVSLPTVEALVQLGSRICTAEGIPLTKVKLRQLASLDAAMDYRVLISNLYRVKLDMGRTDKLTSNPDTLPGISNLEQQAIASLDRIILETRINTQLANFVNLPVHNMIGTILTHIPEHDILIHNRDTRGQPLPSNFAEFKQIYDQRLLHAVESDMAVYYNDLLDNIPIVISAIGHEILKAAAAKKHPPRPILLKLLGIMSHLAQTYRQLMPLEDTMAKERDSEPKMQLFKYLIYSLFGMTVILNQLNQRSGTATPVVKDLLVEYHHQYNSFKQTAMMITNNISLAWNNIPHESNATQQYINQPAAFLTQDPELMYIVANSAKLPHEFQSLKPICQDKLYQSALSKISTQLTVTTAKLETQFGTKPSSSRTNKSSPSKTHSPSTATSTESVTITKPKAKKKKEN